MHRPTGPGLTKARPLPLVRTRTVELWQGNDYRWRELFESADVMSEGATRPDDDGTTYYGSTSLLLPRKGLGVKSRKELERVARLVRGDPHARVRAVRIACREAQLRARAPLGTVSADLRVRVDRRGVWLDIDLAAPLDSEDSSENGTSPYRPTAKTKPKPRPKARSAVARRR